MFARFLSLCVAGLYLWVAAQMTPPQVIRALIFLVFPMACIWFGDELGEYTGSWGTESITQATPGFLVRFGGWLILVGVPILVFLLGR